MLKLFYRFILLAVLILSATLLYQKNTNAYHTLTRTNPIPHTKQLMQEKKYKEAYDYLHYFIQFDYVKENPEANTLLNTIQATRQSFSYRSKKIVEGIKRGTSDELSGQLAAIGSDFFVIGDLRDLAIAGKHYLHHEKIDPVLVALSTIGLAATASTLFTLGAGSVAKSGVSVLKLARKSKRMPDWLGRYLIREAKLVRHTKDISHLKPLFKTLNSMHKEAGLQETLKLLSHTKNLQELKTLSKLAKRYGKETDLLLNLSNKTLLKEAERFGTMDKQTVKVASTYGENGFSHLLKGGEKNFLKTVKRMKAFAKTGYKGEIWKVFLWLMQHLSNTMLMFFMGISSLLLVPFRKIKLHFNKSINKTKSSPNLQV